LCRRGDTDSHRVLVTLGDSHARAWIPALDRIARRAHFATYHLVKPGCAAARVTPHAGPAPFVACSEWREWAIDQIRALRPDIVFMASAMPPAVVGPGGGVVRRRGAVAAIMKRGFISTIRAVDGRAGKVFLAEDDPRLTFEPAHCLGSPTADLGDCANHLTRASRLISRAQRNAARKTTAALIPTRRWFCAEGLCPAVVGSTVTHRDPGHVTTAYSLLLNRALQEAMGLQ
jgi:hypothetical protein